MPQSSKAATFYVTFFHWFIVVSLLTTLFQAFEVRWLDASQAVLLESAIDVCLLLEVIVRLLACPTFGTYLLSPYAVIDIMAAAPLALRAATLFNPLPSEGRERVIRAVFLGFVPLLRLLKTLRHSRKFHLLSKAFLLAFEALPTLLFFYALLWVTFSTFIYAIEPPENLPNIMQAMWLTVVSMTTVGYGDVSPVTPLGKLTIAVLVIFSALYMAIPLGILGGCFSQVWHERDKHLLTHRVRASLQLEGFTCQDLPILFSSFDKDRDGSLNFMEFHNMVEKLRLGLSDERLADLFEQVDEDNGGTINVEEFIKFLSPAHHWELYGMEQARERITQITTVTPSASKVWSDEETAKPKFSKAAIPPSEEETAEPSSSDVI